MRDALDNFLRTLINSLGQLIVFTAAILPWLPAVALAYWVARRLWRRRRARKGVPTPVASPGSGG